MSEGTYSKGLSPHQQLQEQALAIKRRIIDAWISDLPQIPPTPESQRLGPPEPSTRRKITKSPIKRQRPAAKARGRGGKISQPRPQPGDDAPPIDASSYQQTLGSIALNEETTLTLNASARRTLESRASSPTRNRNDLESAVPKIICRLFTDGMAMREDVRSLRQKLMAAARHRGVLPLSLKVRFRNKMSV
jgi:hypothetical protein